MPGKRAQKREKAQAAATAAAEARDASNNTTELAQLKAKLDKLSPPNWAVVVAGRKPDAESSPADARDEGMDTIEAGRWPVPLHEPRRRMTRNCGVRRRPSIPPTCCHFHESAHQMLAPLRQKIKEAKPRTRHKARFGVATVCSIVPRSAPPARRPAEVS